MTRHENRPPLYFTWVTPFPALCAVHSSEGLFLHRGQPFPMPVDVKSVLVYQIPAPMLFKGLPMSDSLYSVVRQELEDQLGVFCRTKMMHHKLISDGWLL